jgi:3-methyladenine DNA glycosylase AlkD
MERKKSGSGSKAASPRAIVTTEQALAELEALGTEQNRKVYPRHGARQPVYGVPYADMYKLAKRWSGDQSLAVGLWASGVHDARVMATMIADPELTDGALLDSWLADVDNYGLAGAVAGLAVQTSVASAKAAEWRSSPDEWPSAAGWNATAILALQTESSHEMRWASEMLPDEYFAPLLETIERDLPSAPNRTRHEMNGALIAIGLRGPALREAALTVAARLGPVRVDHGQTGCKTPAAAPYIAKVLARRDGLAKRQLPIA